MTFFVGGMGYMPLGTPYTHLLATIVFFSNGVTAISLYHYSMCPRPSVLSLHCYGRSCWKNRKVFLFTIVLNICLTGLKASYLASSLLTFIGSLFIRDSRPLIGLLNSILAGLGSPAPMGDEHICRTARLTSRLPWRHFNYAFYKPYAYYHLAIALVVVGLCYWLLDVHQCAKVSDCLWCKIPACIWNNLLRELILS